MTDALKAFLEEKGYTGLYADNMPTEAAASEAIGLFCWSHTVADINDGSGTFFIQIQVRRKTRQAAKAVCNELFAMTVLIPSPSLLGFGRLLTTEMWLLRL